MNFMPIINNRDFMFILKKEGGKRNKENKNNQGHYLIET